MAFYCRTGVNDFLNIRGISKMIRSKEQITYHSIDLDNFSQVKEAFQKIP
jgi:hypothetical protein